MSYRVFIVSPIRDDIGATRAALESDGCAVLSIERHLDPVTQRYPYHQALVDRLPRQELLESLASDEYLRVAYAVPVYE